ncbi:MAG: valine--tRNA ligase [Candidatus Ancaeobacter aquaticus]|nr:valine--tRNA ligase [Candidatus Ancaeobacter aquaticus]
MVELPKQYNPKEVEQEIKDFWLNGKFAHADSDKGGTPYTIVIPPPNITGILHMGHALNNTIQDVLTRWKRMEGFNALWLPGTDHAGIATQNVVEKKLMHEKKTRKDVGRDAFIEKVWKWREEYGGTIIKQLKMLGCSCDWDRERFTMDEGLSDAVSEVFIKLYDKGLIYRGNYIINWCPRCETALSDEEAEHREIDGSLYYIKYHVEDSKETITVATTRPETMLGDVAVAINPKDARYTHLIDKTIILPLVNRKMKVITDDFVDPEFGTGVVKVTPAHDPNDFEMGLRHKLTPINVMHENGVMNENAGEAYEGMDRFEAREAILLDLKELKLLEKVDHHSHAVGHCYRCHSVVEPRLSRQWFVKMKPLAEPALKAHRDGKIKFHPARWNKVYTEWLENIRDWCISRQIWWGHRIPVWYCNDCDKEIASKDCPKECPQCKKHSFTQDEDVLDTWFSSWLWPFSTLGWPEKTKDLDFYYPTNCLVTAQEIIFFWVARMIMSGIEFMGEVPFSDVYIHGTVRDDSGTKMSKSLGNIIDPLDIIEKYGADALRFSIIMITSQGQDVYLSEDKFEIGRNFANKIWNASRFLMMNFEDVSEQKLDNYKDMLTVEDRYILSRMNLTIKNVNKALGEYRFNEACHLIYDFFWHYYCDRYIESAKLDLYSENDKDKIKTKVVLKTVLETSMKLLHPFMPYITEEIWRKLNGESSDTKKTIMHAQWPQVNKVFIDEKIISKVEKKYEMIRCGRNLRTEYKIPPKNEVEFIFKAVSEEGKKFFESEKPNIMKQLKASQFDIVDEFTPDRPMVSNVCETGTVYLSLEGNLDLDAEKDRLQKSIEKLGTQIEQINKKLLNRNFVERAPKEVVEKEENNKKELEEKIKKIETNISHLQ